MKTLDHNAIHRSLANMGFRLGAEIYQTRHQADSYGLTEVLQQFQIPISGRVSTGSFIDVLITFPEVIYYAPMQRDCKNEDPQFTWGIQLDQGNAVFSAHVTNWTLDNQVNYTGATVRVNASAPSVELGSLQVFFSGTLHCTFEGLSIPVEDPGFDENP